MRCCRLRGHHEKARSVRVAKRDHAILILRPTAGARTKNSNSGTTQDDSKQSTCSEHDTTKRVTPKRPRFVDGVFTRPHDNRRCVCLQRIPGGRFTPPSWTRTADALHARKLKTQYRVSTKRQTQQNNAPASTKPMATTQKHRSVQDGSN